MSYGGDGAVDRKVADSGYLRPCKSASIFKRGMKGIYQHCQKKHLHRYVAEFEFRYNNREKLGCNDQDRAGNALRGIAGKRLTYTAAN